MIADRMDGKEKREAGGCCRFSQKDPGTVYRAFGQGMAEVKIEERRVGQRANGLKHL